MRAAPAGADRGGQDHQEPELGAEERAHAGEPAREPRPGGCDQDHHEADQRRERVRIREPRHHHEHQRRGPGCERPQKGGVAPHELKRRQCREALDDHEEDAPGEQRGAAGDRLECSEQERLPGAIGPPEVLVGPVAAPDPRGGLEYEPLVVQEHEAPKPDRRHDDADRHEQRR